MCLKEAKASRGIDIMPQCCSNKLHHCKQTLPALIALTLKVVLTFANIYFGENIGDIRLLLCPHDHSACLGHLGCHDKNGNDPIFAVSPKVAKASTITVSQIWRQKLCQWRRALNLDVLTTLNRRQDTQHNDNQHNDTQHNDITTIQCHYAMLSVGIFQMLC
jgi:hypothetical protein